MILSIPSALVAFILPFLHFSNAINVKIGDQASLRAASKRIANGLLDYYHPGEVGIFGDPYYWWEAGAAWGGLIDYYAYTRDKTFVDTVNKAIAAQAGPKQDFIVPNHEDQEGNDDQAFWICAALSGLELNHPEPSGLSWLKLATAGFENMASRWDMDTCNGGLTWQIYATNVNGLDYKNSISNGGLFQIAARLARYTGDSRYVDWAKKAWDWMAGIGLISEDYKVYDGTDKTKNCTEIDGKVEWTYNNAMLLYGAAALYSLTGETVWQDRVNGLLNMAQERFFSPFPNATNIIFESACEPYETCNPDMLSFKGYLSRWMSKTAMLMPETKDTIMTLLQASAEAAAQSCVGGNDGHTCGNKWYVSGWDGTWGVGQQLTALETIQALLVAQGGQPVTQKGVVLKGQNGGQVAAEEPKAAVTPATPSSKPVLTSTTPAPALPASSIAAAESEFPSPSRSTTSAAIGTPFDWLTPPTPEPEAPFAWLTLQSSSNAKTVQAGIPISFASSSALALAPSAGLTMPTAAPESTTAADTLWNQWLAVGYIAKAIGNAVAETPDQRY